MAYLGKFNGPRESLIVGRMDWTMFDVEMPGQVEQDIEWYEDEERRGEITPVTRDESGHPYLLLKGRTKLLVYRFSAAELKQLDGDHQFMVVPLPPEYETFQGQ